MGVRRQLRRLRRKRSRCASFNIPILFSDRDHGGFRLVPVLWGVMGHGNFSRATLARPLRARGVARALLLFDPDGDNATREPPPDDIAVASAPAVNLDEAAFV
jgi:hypothetical protein